jgi:hypothetical protein
LVNGTIDDGINALQVFGNAVVASSPSAEVPTLGAEIMTTATGTSWAGTSLATGYTKTAGNGNILFTTVSITAGTLYRMTVTTTGISAGTISMSYGGTVLVNIISTNTTTIIDFKALTTSTIGVYPTTTFNGTVAISVKSITAPIIPIMTYETSAGAVLSEVRHWGTDGLYWGANAGRYAKSALRSIGIGYNSLSNIIGPIADDNTALGYSTLSVAVDAAANTAIGANALKLVTTNYNTAVGANALSAQATGIANVAIGADALKNLTGSAGLASDNIAIGYRAGEVSQNSGNLTASGSSIFIGTQCSPQDNNQQGQIVIGHLGTGLGSNSTVIGGTYTTKAGIYGRLLLAGAAGGAFTFDDGITALQVYGQVNQPVAMFDMPAMTNAPTGGVPDCITTHTRGHNGTSNNRISGHYAIMEGQKNVGFDVTVPAAGTVSNSIGYDFRLTTTDGSNVAYRAVLNSAIMFSVSDTGLLYTDKLTYRMGLPAGDMNTLTTPGWYWGDDTLLNSPDTYVFIQVEGSEADGTPAYYKQTVTQMFGAGGVNRTWYRVGQPGAWSAWSQLVLTTQLAPKVYEALISQSSTSAPTVTILGENTIGAIVWTRTATGTYLGTLTNAFTTNKTTIQMTMGGTNGVCAISATATNTVSLRTWTPAGALADSLLNNASILIKVFP